MAFPHPLGVFLLSCLVALASCRVAGPPVDLPGHGETGANGSDGLMRPAGRPGEPEEPPSPFFGRFGMRCPLAQTWEEYRMNCAEYIDERCGCVYDDMHIDQTMCVLGNRTEYERLVHQQIELEKERDEVNVRDEGISSGERYFRVLDCLHDIPNILARNGNGNDDRSNGNGHSEETQGDSAEK